MDITAVIDKINADLGVNLSAAYYEHVNEWLSWWEGYHKPFHGFTEVGLDGNRLQRKLYTLKMGKKVCEDWAAILLNDKTTITIDDAASSVFVQGAKDEEGTGGVFGATRFWQRGNALVEKAFATGTGAVVLRMRGMRQMEDGSAAADPSARIAMEFLPATYIIPLTVREEQIIDVAFASDVLVQGKKYIYLETHVLKEGGYAITNRYFKQEQGDLLEEPLPPGIAPVWNTGSDVPLFSIVSPNIVNNVGESYGLGVSIFANAIDNLMGVDLAYNNFCRDFKLGGKKVFVNQSLTKRDDRGNVVTPDDVAQQLFTVVGNTDIQPDKDLIHEFNPLLRVQENIDGVQGQLDFLSFKVGFGTKHYQFNGSSIVTATQYTGDKQELVQNAAKHYIAVEAFMKSLVRSILWAGKEVCGQKKVNPDAKVTVNFEDSYIIDKESERQRDREDVRDGLMQKWEYRVKWYGEDEETAKKMVAVEKSDDDWMGFGGE